MCQEREGGGREGRCKKDGNANSSDPTHTCAYIPIAICPYIYIHIYICICICIYICVYIYIYPYTNIHLFSLFFIRRLCSPHAEALASLFTTPCLLTQVSASAFRSLMRYLYTDTLAEVVEDSESGVERGVGGGGGAGGAREQMAGVRGLEGEGEGGGILMSSDGLHLVHSEVCVYYQRGFCTRI